MPLMRCTINGKKGWKWGKSGKCYLSKAKAAKQGRAIKASQSKRGK